MDMKGTLAASVATSFVTATVATQAIDYVEKLAAVLILAMVAEAGRRVVGALLSLWRKQ